MANPPPGYYDYNGKRYRSEGSGTWGATPLTPEEIAASNGAASDGKNADGVIAMTSQVGPQPSPQKSPEQQAAEAQQRNFDNHFNYGGQPGQAAADANFFRGQGNAAQNRPGEQINYGLAQGAYGNSMANGAAQDRVATLMWNRANGLVPSIAQQQGDRQMQQLNAAQTSAQASARGPAAMALAQQGAAANTAAGQANISGQVQINAAQERLQAEQAAMGAYSGMRGQDLQGAGLQAGWAQAQAGMNAQQRAQNDAYSQNMYGNEIGIHNSQLQAQGSQVNGQNQMALGRARLAQDQGQYDSSRWDKYLGYGVGALGTVAAVGATAYFGGGGKGGDGSGGSVGGGAGEPSANPSEQGYHGSMEGYKPPDPNDPNNTSDISAKQNITPLGGGGLHGDPRASAWDEGHAAAIADMQKLAHKSPQELKSYGEQPMASAVRGMRADAWDEGHGAPQQGDPVTAQFAQGLAPSAYDYKPGLGTPGRKVGPMAQNMASNPTTGSAIRQDPNSGLLSIDNNDGIKVALGGVGHLASKQQAMEAELARMKAGGGLQQPSAGQAYLNYVRGR